MPTTNMTMIPINKPWLDEEERHEIMSVLDENALTVQLTMEEENTRL